MPLLKKGDVADSVTGECYEVTPRTLYRLIDQGQLPSYQMGRVIRLKQEDLDGYLERARIEPGALRHLYPDAQRPGQNGPTESP